MAAAERCRYSSAGPGGEARTQRERRQADAPEPRHSVRPGGRFPEPVRGRRGLGYRVLEQTIEEIKEGYKEAQAFNGNRRSSRLSSEADGARQPPIPWEQLVDRVSAFQDIALEAVREGNRHLLRLDQVRPRTTRSLAKTGKEPRQTSTSGPSLAGPVFEDPSRSATDRATADPVPCGRFDHRGLTRLRIHASHPRWSSAPCEEPAECHEGRESQGHAELSKESASSQPDAERSEDRRC